MLNDLIGTLIGGYRVERLLGEGGMGAVYEARHPQLGRRLAIKVLLGAYANHPVITARFVQEAIVAAQVEHDNIVEVIDTATLPDGRHYIALEFLDGCDLEQYVENRSGRLGERDAALIIMQVCAGLHAAHLRGVVHRDLKPPNIFITSDRTHDTLAKILDFGISKLRGAIKATSLQTGATTIMGTPEYMAPEQSLSPQTVDARADIFALGCIIYRVLTGRLPFHAETAEAYLFAKREQQPPPLRSLRPDVSPTWEVVVSRCLSWDPEGRYSDVHMLVGELVDGIAGQSAGIPDGHDLLIEAWPDFGRSAGVHDETVRAPTGSIPAHAIAPRPSSSTLTAAAGARGTPVPRSTASTTRVIVVGVGVVLALGTGVSAVALMNRGSEGSPVVAPSAAPHERIVPEHRELRIETAQASESTATPIPPPPVVVISAPPPTPPPQTNTTMSPRARKVTRSLPTTSTARKPDASATTTPAPKPAPPKTAPPPKTFDPNGVL